MRILSITAQKPHSTGSGIYLTELVNHWNRMGHAQAVLAGVYEDDVVAFEKGVIFYPVTYLTEALPFAITGMSDEMPYKSTRYQDITDEMFEQYQTAFEKAVRAAVEEFCPDLIVCHHLYLLTAMVRSWYPKKTIIGLCHGSDLRQIEKNERQRAFIKEHIRKLNGVIALHAEQKKEILRIFACEEKQVHVLGVGYNENIFYRCKEQIVRKKQIAFAGKVTEKKGIFSLLRALEKMPYEPEEVCLKVAGGSGEKEEYCKILEEARKSKYQIEFLGVLTQKELAQLFRESEVFVLPSFFEGLPLVTMEAMACGCKVVCSEIPGMKMWLDENVKGHRMELVPLPKMKNVDEPMEEELPQFEERLAKAIQRQLQAEESSADLSGVSWEGISRKLLDIYS